MKEEEFKNIADSMADNIYNGYEDGYEDYKVGVVDGMKHARYNPNPELIKKIIDLTLGQVRDQGWDLLDAQGQEQIDMVYDAIEDDITNYVEELKDDDEFDNL